MKKARPFQKEDVDRMHTRYKGRVLNGNDMGLGKAQPIDKKVATPTGWKKIGDLKVGDLVIGSNGKFTKVLGIYKKGIRKVYEIEFTDKSKTECCDEHLWNVNTATRNKRGNPYKTLPLKVIRKTLTQKNGNRNHYIPMISPVQYPKNKVPIHPYLLGYVVANGCMRHGRIMISSADAKIIERIKTLLPPGMTLTKIGKYDYNIIKGKLSDNILIRNLKKLKLYGKKANRKFIPKNYLLNDVKTRIQLLQGLMDGDGYVNNDSLTQYCTVSKKLSENFRDLVHSLGGSDRTNKAKTQYTYKGVKKQGQDAYTHTIAFSPEITPFWISRKKDKYKPRKKYKPTRAFKTVKYIGKKECVCIRVSAKDHLYATDDFILTHNTFETLLYFKTYVDKGPMVVVCPASVKYNWQIEAADLGLRSFVLEKRKPPSNINHLIRNPSKTIYIINDEILGKGITQTNTWNRFLRRLKPTFVAYDECHRLKSRSTQRTKNFRELVSKVDKVAMLSGTPMTSRPAELWPTLNILRPDKFPSFLRFANRYCKPEWTPWGMKYTGATRLDELHKLLKKYCMIRRRKKDVLDQLPPKTRTIIQVDISPADMREYRLAEKDFIKWLRKTNPKKASGARRSERLTRFGYLKRLTGKIKLKAVREWINDYLEESSDKLITFGVHKSVVGQLHTEYPTSVKVDGSITGEKRQRAFDKFKKDPKCRLFFGNIQAAGVGWNGQIANDVMFAELGWTPGEHTQAEDRAHRMGQKRPVNIYYLVAKGTVEENLIKMIQKKQNIIDNALDGKEGVEGFDLLDQLEKVLLKKGK